MVQRRPANSETPTTQVCSMSYLDARWYWHRVGTNGAMTVCNANSLKFLSQANKTSHITAANPVCPARGRKLEQQHKTVVPPVAWRRMENNHSWLHQTPFNQMSCSGSPQWGQSPWQNWLFRGRKVRKLQSRRRRRRENTDSAAACHLNFAIHIITQAKIFLSVLLSKAAAIPSLHDQVNLDDDCKWKMSMGFHFVFLEWHFLHYSALRHAEIVVHVQFGRGGWGLNMWPSKDRGTNLSSRSRARKNSTQAKVSTAVEDIGSMIEDKMLQVCSCGWQRLTSIKGLGTHQGKKCLAKKRQSGLIDQYFWRSQFEGYQ